MFSLLFSVVAMLCSLVGLVCFIMVILKLFSNGDTTMGIVCLVTIFCGIGGIIAFIYGWMKADVYGLKNVMIIWSVALGIGILTGIGLGALSPELPDAHLDRTAPVVLALAD